MRLSEDRIRAAILHPEQEVRIEAVSYWSDSESPDPSVMPMVIQAVEQYGRENAFRIMRDADSLTQTPATVDWMVSELGRAYDMRDVQQDNYRFAVAMALVEADPDLLIPRQKNILSLPAFPGQLRQSLDDQLRFHLMEWPALWAELERLGHETMEREETTREDTRRAHRLIRAMGRHTDEAGQVIRALDRKVSPSKQELMDWLDAELVELAGRMKLVNAIPRIMRRVEEDNEAVLDKCGRALGRIGTDIVVDEISFSWSECESDPRMIFCEALEGIHTDRCVERCLEFLADEEDFMIAAWLGRALLAHLDPEVISTVRELILDNEEDDDEEKVPEHRDLKFLTVAAATIMGVEFPEYAQWHKEAVATNYGWGNHVAERVADHF